MLALFRHPLIRLLGRLWWLAVLIPAAAWGLAGDRGLEIASRCISALLLAIVGMVVGVWIRAAKTKRQTLASDRIHGRRFLCPQCLLTDDFHIACACCGKRIDDFVYLTAGVYVNDCPSCGKRIPRQPEKAGQGVKARCRHCDGVFDWEEHYRQVKVVGVLFPEDIDYISQDTGLQPKHAGAITYLCDTTIRGKLTYVVNLSDLDDVANDDLQTQHALWQVEAIWVGEAGDRPLNLGEAVGRLINHTRMKQNQPQHRAITIHVQQKALESASLNLLEKWFGRIRYEVTPNHLLGRADQSSPDVAARDPELVHSRSSTDLTSIGATVSGGKGTETASP